MLAGVGGLLPAVEQRHLVSEPVVQSGNCRGICLSCEPQRPRELRGRLAVRRQFGRSARRSRGMAQDRCTVRRRLRVKGHPGVIITVLSMQGIEDPGVDKPAAMRGDGLLHSQPGDLMPEP